MQKEGYFTLTKQLQFTYLSISKVQSEKISRNNFRQSEHVQKAYFYMYLCS